MNCAGNEIPTIADLGCIFQNLAGSLLGLAGVAIFVILLIGGFKYITSGGDPKAVESARQTFTYGIIGFIIVLASYLILVLIKQITGVDVTKFNFTLQQ